jgi:hypothetical protein
MNSFVGYAFGFDPNVAREGKESARDEVLAFRPLRAGAVQHARGTCGLAPAARDGFRCA